jgi:hypothetical protein
MDGSGCSEVLDVGSPLEAVDEGGRGGGEVVDTAVPADGCDACMCMPLMAMAIITCPSSHGLLACLPFSSSIQEANT